MFPQPRVYRRLQRQGIRQQPLLLAPFKRIDSLADNPHGFFITPFRQENSRTRLIHLCKQTRILQDADISVLRLGLCSCLDFSPVKLM
jgi:hypothetical protein